LPDQLFLGPSRYGLGVSAGGCSGSARPAQSRRVG
jgi:hypothetical protein